MLNKNEVKENFGIYRPERATRFSEGRSPSKACAKSKPCKGVRIMRAALTGLNKHLNANVGLRPTLRRDALSGWENSVVV